MCVRHKGKGSGTKNTSLIYQRADHFGKMLFLFFRDAYISFTAHSQRSFPHIDKSPHKCYDVSQLWGDCSQLRRLKPDPLNLLVNTGVGKQIYIRKIFTLVGNRTRVFLFFHKEEIK